VLGIKEKGLERKRILDAGGVLSLITGSDERVIDGVRPRPYTFEVLICARQHDIMGGHCPLHGMRVVSVRVHDEPPRIQEIPAPKTTSGENHPDTFVHRAKRFHIRGRHIAFP